VANKTMAYGKPDDAEKKFQDFFSRRVCMMKWRVYIMNTHEPISTAHTTDRNHTPSLSTHNTPDTRKKKTHTVLKTQAESTKTHTYTQNFFYIYDESEKKKKQTHTQTN
jgi:hypothetical protein